jgi:hypothetical protein
MSHAYSHETGRILDDFLKALEQRGDVDRMLLQALKELRAEERLSSPKHVQEVVKQFGQARDERQD